jgi:hypothetical protein
VVKCDESRARSAARGLLWLAALCSVGGCPSGAADNGFGSFTGSLPMTTSATGADAGSDDNDSQITADAVGTVDSTAGGTSNPTSGPSTMTSGSDSGGGTAGDCAPACAPDEVCIAGNCLPGPGGSSSDGPAICNDVPGNYEACLGVGNAVDTSGCGVGGATCITGGDPVIAGVCSVTGCADACECPGAPATGNADAACDAITGGAETFCYLDCASGETCPDGMVCFANLACVWGGEGADGVPYGDCLNGGPSTCGLEGLCLNDGPVPTIGVCTIDCAVLGDCPASPGGTAPVACTDVTGDAMPECILDCNGGGSCPAGMSCFSSTLCAWM